MSGEVGAGGGEARGGSERRRCGRQQREEDLLLRGSRLSGGHHTLPELNTEATEEFRLYRYVKSTNTLELLLLLLLTVFELSILSPDVVVSKLHFDMSKNKLGQALQS